MRDALPRRISDATDCIRKSAEPRTSNSRAVHNRAAAAEAAGAFSKTSFKINSYYVISRR